MTQCCECILLFFPVVDGSVIGGVERKAVYMKEDNTEDQESEEEANRSEQGILAVLFSKGGECLTLDLS